MTDPETIITIKREAFGVAFDVIVTGAPPHEGSFDKEYPTYGEARGYARGLRLARGWKLIDLSGEDVE